MTVRDQGSTAPSQHGVRKRGKSVKSYVTENIRNIVLVGHGGSGKTSLAESLLFLSGATTRLGKISEGNTVCDFDEEEIRKQISISTTLAPVEWDGHKIN